MDAEGSMLLDLHDELAARPAVRSPRVGPESEQGQERVIMSVVYCQNRLGVAAYSESTSELSLCEVFEHEEDFSRLQLLKFQVQPTLIVTNSSAGRCEHFVDALTKDVENETHIFPVEFIKSSEYAYEASKRKMLLLKLPGMPSDLTQQDRLQFFSSLVPLDQTQMVRSLGGLIFHLLKSRIVNELESNDEPIAIGKLSLLPVAGAMRIDMDTLKALSVFSTETHPSSHGIGKPKEGFSLFSLYRPHTPLGKRLLRKWFLLPQTTTALLHDRLQHIDYLTRTRDGATLQEIGTVAAKYIKDVPRLLTRIQAASSSVSDWTGLFQSLIGCIRIKELCEPHELRLFKQVVASFNEPLYDLVHTLASTIDFEASKEFGRLTIKEGVCPSLDELRSIYQNLDSLLTSFAKEELTTLASPLVTSLSIVYYPQVGYQVVIPQRPDVALGELVKCATLEYQFHTTKYAYFKNSFMRELDQSDELGDIWGRITDTETSLILALEAMVVAQVAQLSEVANLVAELDCIAAMASCANQYKWCAPTLCESNCIRIKNGRHPLQELCDDLGTFIPNDAELGGDDSHVLLLSGANGSGKSVYLKQVGLIVFLAHIGSFVPADEATIGLTDQIFSRIYSRETASVQVSSFMIDLNQVAAMLRHATGRSLLLLDEFGKGTNVVDGVSVLGGALHHLLSREETPKAIVSTHLGEYFDNQTLLPETRALSFVHMDVFVKEDDAQRDVVFMYKLRPGSARQSYGHYVGQLSGIPQAVVERAEAVKALLAAGQPVRPLHASGGHNQRRRQDYEAICDKFRRFDCARGDVQAFLADLWRDADASSAAGLRHSHALWPAIFLSCTSSRCLIQSLLNGLYACSSGL